MRIIKIKYKYAPKKKRQKNQIKRQHVTKEPTHRQLHVSRVSLCVNSTNTHTGTQRAQITIDVQQLTSKECQWIRSSSRAVVRTSGLDMFERPLHLNFLASPFEFIDKKLRLHHPTSSLPTKKREIASRHLGPLECVFYVQQFFVQSNGKANFKKKRKEKQTKWTRISLSTLSKGEDFNEMWADGKNGRITDDDDERSNRCRCVDVRHCLHAARVSRAGSLEGNCATQLGRRNCAYKMEPTRAGRAG